MIRRPPRSTRTDTLFPYTTLFRSTQRNAQLRSRSGVAACYVGPGFVTKIGIFCTDISLASLNRFVDLRRRHPVLQAGTFQDIIPEGSRQMMDILFQKLEYLTRMLPQRRSEERRVGKEVFSTCSSRCSPDH